MAEGGVDSFSDSIIEERFSCSICLEPFKKPKILPCFHTFCTPCLAGHVVFKADANSSFECPLCRALVKVPEGGVEGFQSNFYVEREESVVEDFAVTCDVCDHVSPAVLRCEQCEENFCAVCAKTHRKMKATRDHTLNDRPVTMMKTRRIRSEIQALLEGPAQEPLQSLKQHKTGLEKLNIHVTRYLERDLENIREHGKIIHETVDKALKEFEDTVELLYSTTTQENEQKILKCEEEGQNWISLLEYGRTMLGSQDEDVLKNGPSLCQNLKERGRVYDICLEEGRTTEGLYKQGEISTDVVKGMIGQILSERLGQTTSVSYANEQICQVARPKLKRMKGIKSSSSQQAPARETRL